MKQRSHGVCQVTAAAKAGIHVQTGRKYEQLGQPPSTLVPPPHAWRTRLDPFTAVWDHVEAMLMDAPGLEAKTLFLYLQRQHPGRFPDGQLRTFQRKVKRWRALSGPDQEVYFPQQHQPGDVCASDFCHLDALGITLAGIPFPHLLYHCVLTYSNWETGTICQRESFESLASGLQQALRAMGGVPQRHRTDALTVAVNAHGDRGQFTKAYQALLAHYGLRGEHTQPRHPHENGDVEQRHHRFKRALEQALLLRGSRDFTTRDDYAAFIRALFVQLNAGRQARFREEQRQLRPLPASGYDARKTLKVSVGRSSTIRVQNNTYSVPSRLIGETVQVIIDGEWVEIAYGQRRIDRVPRLRGHSHARINYRHVIHWLARKPGAFRHYRWRDELFPSSIFRVAYDQLTTGDPRQADKQYLQLLQWAADDGEARVQTALTTLIERGDAWTLAAVRTHLDAETVRPSPIPTVEIPSVNLLAYDHLLTGKEVGHVACS